MSTTQQLENCKREISIMKLLSHPHIVRLLDVVEKEQEQTTYLVVEFVSGGELFDYIVANGTIKEKEARKFFRQIISAVEYCHGNLVVHRDLKPENLLLDSSGNIKISDFGLSNCMEPGKLMESFCGSPLYAAPEILMAERYIGPPVDIWSMGVILYALLCGHLPWNGDNQAEISFNSVRGRYDEPPNLSREARSFIRRMLTPDPKRRITIDEMRHHPWVNDGYTTLPQSFLPIRQPVHEIRADIVEKLNSLGFHDSASVRKKILANECCQPVAIYHLLLDRIVQTELEDIKNCLARASISPSPSSSSFKDLCSPLPVSPSGSALPTMNAPPMTPTKTPNRILGFSSEKSKQNIGSPKLDVIHENDAHGDDMKRNPFRKSYPQQQTTASPVLAGMVMPQAHSYSTPREDSLQTNAPSPISISSSSVDSSSSSLSSTCESLHLSNPLSGSAPVAVDPVPPGRSGAPQYHQRRFSITGDSLKGIQQHLSQNNQSSAPAPPQPRGRKFSLDSNAMAQEHTDPQQQPYNPAGPRQVKGIFKASTTTTKSPEEAAKHVKKTMSQFDSLFVKKRSPFVFLCFDEVTGVKFQVEVCKLLQLDMTGIHLKRVSGDIWQYKNLCNDLVNVLAL
eukprot:TRINITY_DN5207_c0_g1_i1.p1 TRINITY_DN5207_c0_g1~~TRINITY_DN5207_c0_g1_i1.p1  ORF type:complete len:727 (-),score=182.92 TRINITY_DN5207_c0_g1_i1:43-1914(-)